MDDLARMTRGGRPFAVSERTRIVFLGVLLAAFCYVVFFYQPGGGAPDVSPVITEKTPIPTLDREILAQAKDATRNERLTVEPEPLAHLLEKSLMVVPAVAKALGMPLEPVSFDVLRANPDANRGRYLWYKGEVEALDKGRDGHPVHGYRTYEARIKTAEGERVQFYFSVPPPEDITVGSWVRVEGFFLKLRDAHFPVQLDLAPVLVGPELLPAYPDWKAVETLDPAVLAKIKDGVRQDGVDVDVQQASVRLPFAQDVPLFHLASYAMHRETVRTPEETAALPAFDKKDQWSAIYRGEVERGTPYRLAGIFQRAHVVEARANPLGLENWSEVWLYSRGFAQRPFAVWLPKHVGEWSRADTARCVGYFFKRYVVEGGDGQPHFCPLFVAADLERVDFNPLAASQRIGVFILGVAGALVLIFFVLARLDRRDTRTHEQSLLQRRRRRRGLPTPASTT
ncbi:MAG: hypothetical protein R3F56_11270 [Planctomycetota bacterium]